ncbi:hypothetical protein IQ07DRAFT_622891 [Pyrenochaeta sp. DS3sAY3a]|nr:hypothetical protein IQ07DRAFT_622891 [Pyrenochaeta sp. DS3sAY3a]
MFRIRPPFRAFQLPPRPTHIPLRNTQSPLPLRSTQPTHPLPLPFRPNAPHRFYQKHPFNRRPQYKRFNGSASSGFLALLYRWAARPTFYRDIGLLTAGTATIYTYNLDTVPVSGRRRFNMISPALEESLGKATVEQVRQEYAGRILPDYDPRVQQVKRVLERLLPFAEGEGLRDLDWEVTVIDAPEQNAFVAPGGKVFVFTGILPLCRDEDGIAAVLGHEIAHVIAHHTAERLSRTPLLLLGLAALSLLDISFSSSALLLDIFLSMPASRKHEAEADYIGLMMMAQGCFRPAAALEFWTRMEKMGGQGPPQILSTHPSNHNRGEMIRGWHGEIMHLG